MVDILNALQAVYGRYPQRLRLLFARIFLVMQWSADITVTCHVHVICPVSHPNAASLSQLHCRLVPNGTNMPHACVITGSVEEL